MIRRGFGGGKWAGGVGDGMGGRGRLEKVEGDGG